MDTTVPPKPCVFVRTYNLKIFITHCMVYTSAENAENAENAEKSTFLENVAENAEKSCLFMC